MEQIALVGCIICFVFLWKEYRDEHKDTEEFKKVFAEKHHVLWEKYYNLLYKYNAVLKQVAEFKRAFGECSDECYNRKRQLSAAKGQITKLKKKLENYK